ncbi:hypothetical protein [Sphingomonas sp. PAMC 26605]|uniref:hypothetical protein n=1 Tax=Sphingomonas sp. PAMC 26605 TaxID=1112214 RepID=UPI00026CDD66|nr:hypothetical protein [Sphingomonas sp. PAMC 26605]
MLLLGLVAATPATAAVPAGTPIVNTAALTFDANGSAQRVASNTVTLLAAERLDVTIQAERPSVAVQSAQLAVPFLVTNSGNGAQTFALAITSTQQGVAVDRVALDRDRDAAFDANVDPIVSPLTLQLAAGEQARIFVLIDGALVAAAATITATVTAQAGTGAAGTVFAGVGANGSDAVVGATGGRASAISTLSRAAVQPALAKSQMIKAPDGSSRAMRGAIITYTLVATLPGPMRGVTIDDPIPAGTAYLADSLALDTVALSDRADADPGTADAAAIHVRLGDLATAGSHTVQFSVKIL